MRKNFKYLIIIIILVGLMIIAGVYYWQEQSIKTPIGQSSEKRAAGNTDSKKKIEPVIDKTVLANNQTYEQAIKSGEVSKCDEMIGDDQKDLCVKLLAVNLANYELCNHIKNKDTLAACQDRVNYEIAVQQKDLKPCQQIKQENLSTSCVINVISQEQYSVEDCQQLPDRQKDICLNYILFNKAISNDDVLLCQGIPSEEDKTGCMRFIFNKKENLAACEEYTDDMQAICVQTVSNNLAIQNQDISLCDKISDLDIQKECKSVVDGLADSDNDQLSNSQEEVYNTNPNKPDTDDDGLSDYEEVAVYETDPNNSDTDSDGYSDGEEVKSGFNPNGEGMLID
jgi:hypothetical protein